MNFIGLILLWLTLIYIQAHIVSEVKLINATMDHSKMSPFHFYDTLDIFLR